MPIAQNHSSTGYRQHVDMPTLRERKKDATRQALHEAVLRLAVDRGWDAVTVEAVADQANVSRRTFSNYFANKEEALFHGDLQRIERLLSQFRARPRSEPAWRALTATAASQYADLDEIDPKWMAQMRLVRMHPALLAQQVATQLTLEEELATEIAARSPAADDAEMRARVMAATFLATIRTVVVLWTTQDRNERLSTAINAGLKVAGEKFR
jgi:AcrR family transcriptional regulator